MKMSDALIEQYELAEKIQLLDHMKRPEPLQVHSLSQKEVEDQSLSKISKYWKNISHTGEAVTQAGDSMDDIKGGDPDTFHDTVHTPDTAEGFHYATLGMAIFNFFRIPFMYLSAYALNQKVPVTLNNNMRWLYSTTLLALTIVAITVPVTAPVIAFVTAALSFVAGAFLLGKIINQRAKLGKKEQTLKREMAHEQEVMYAIRDEAGYLRKALEEATEEHQIIDLSVEVAVLDERSNAQKRVLEHLSNKQEHNKQLRAKLSDKKIIFRSISLILASASIIGLALAVVVPPIGLGVLAGVAIASATYLLARVIEHVAHALLHRKTHKPQAKVEHDVTVDKPLIETPTLAPEKSEKAAEGAELKHEEGKALHVEAFSSDEPVRESTSELLYVLSAEHSSSASEEESQDEPPVLSKKPLFSPPTPNASFSASPQKKRRIDGSPVIHDDEEEDDDSESFEKH